VKKDGVVGGEAGSLRIPVLRVTTMLAKRRRNSSVRGAVPQNTSNARGRKSWEVLFVQGGIQNLLLTLSNASGADRESVRGVVQAACGGVGTNARAI
jgi:transcriptional regulator of nitric oxide reductase